MGRFAKLAVGTIALAFMLCVVPSTYAETDDSPEEIERPQKDNWRNCEHGLPFGECLRCRLDGKGGKRRKGGGDGPFKEERERHKAVMEELRDEIEALQKKIKDAVHEALQQDEDGNQREIVEEVFEQYESEANALAKKIYEARETHAENMLDILKDNEDKMVEGGTQRILRGALRKNRGRGRGRRGGDDDDDDDDDQGNRGRRRGWGPRGDDDDDDDESDRPRRPRGDFF